MLYQLLYPLSEYISGFNLFRYITFRMAYATVTAMLISFLFGNLFIEMLKRYQVKENIRVDGPKTHLAKEGTPTMGGLLILVAIIIPSIFWADLTNRYIQLILMVTLSMGALGFMDDFLKAKRKERKGLVARKKFAGQVAIGLILGTILYLYPPDPNFTTSTDLPFFKNYYLDFGWLYIPFVVLVITGSSNAVNLTDGLDGLAIGLVGICALAFAGLCYITGRIDFSNYLNIQYLNGAGELTVFCGALARGLPGVPLVQRQPGQGLHGRHRGAGLGRHPWRAGASGEEGNSPRHHRRRFRDRGVLGHHPGHVLQDYKKARLQDGAAASPLRAFGLERTTSGGPFLDSRRHLRLVDTKHSENQIRWKANLKIGDFQ